MHPLLSSLDTLIESVAMASQAGQFELNVMLPGMLKCMLEPTDMLKNFSLILGKYGR
ncbi:MAG TPA: hypothetical protein VJ729_18060 [Nitrososphaeraceae archaeon]|nr:hypothetical protein [Nitrososphaeraceae archaeon]